MGQSLLRSGRYIFTLHVTQLTQFASLGVPSPFVGGRIRNVDHLAFRKAMLARDMFVWGGLHISPRGAPSRGAKLCTY